MMDHKKKQILIDHIIPKDKLQTLTGIKTYRGSIFRYNFVYDRTLPSSSGKIFFEDEDFEDADEGTDEDKNNGRFFIFKSSAEAEKMYDSHSDLSHRHLIKPWFCTQHGAKMKWIVAFEKFKYLNNWKDIAAPFTHNNGCLHEHWRTTLKGLVKAIYYMHCKDYLHGQLKDPYSYVLSEKEVKLVNMGRLEQRMSWEDKHNSRMQDFSDFKDMVAQELQLDVHSEDLDLFLQCLEKGRDIKFPHLYDHKYKNFVNKVVEHPLLKCSEERMKKYDEIHLAWKANRIWPAFGKAWKLDGRGGEFEIYRDWNKCFENSDGGQFHYQLYQIYVKGNITYKGDSMEDLLYFCRNVYHHHNRAVVSYDELDDNLSKLCPGFLSRLHENYQISS